MIISTYYQHIISAVKQTGLSIEQVGKICLEHGITGVDVLLIDLKDDCMQNLAKLKALGFTVTSFPAHTDFLHDPSKQLVEKIVESAKELGASVIMAIPGFFNENDDMDSARQTSLVAISYMIELAEKQGIHVGVEDYDDVRSAVAGKDRIKWYLDNEPKLHCIFDTGNFSFMGDDPVQTYFAFKDRIKYQIHCNERTTRFIEGAKGRIRATGEKEYPTAVGNGDVCHDIILADLFESGFDGIVTIEAFGSGDSLNDLTASADYIKQIFDNKK